MDEFALITGSSKGLGEQLAYKLAERGYKIYLHGRDEDNLTVLRQKIKSNYNTYCEYIVADLKTRLGAETIKGYFTKPISVYINNAGVYQNGDITTLSDQEIEDVINVNMLHPILITKHAYTTFKKNNRGTIININSVAGKAGNPQETIYCASKFGLRGFTTSLQMDAGPVKVIDVYPAGIKTDMTKHREDHNNFIHPDEAADVICKSALDYATFRPSELELRRVIY
jgi:short-subunit dehydrogenase